ncbi:MAG: succinate dehydrogenase cytochrome b subunit, partial [Verrucomicrobiae bacterium]|nr:succinate dehydrogenase cytochrome b subunit [Verrucomicrobiae bacterium]
MQIPSQLTLDEKRSVAVSITVFVQIWRSTVGKKYIVGVSGFVLVFFVFVHMMGNFQIFFPPHWINTYGEFLHQRHEIIWPFRTLLLVLFALHVWCAIRLWLANRAARPVGYVGNPPPFETSYASRTMMMSGLFIAAFLIYHVLHYAVELPQVNFLDNIDFRALRDAEGRDDLYLMLLLGFSKWPIAVAYVVFVGLVCLHLSHGMRAMFQSVGWNWTFGGAPRLVNVLA